MNKYYLCNNLATIYEGPTRKRQKLNDSNTLATTDTIIIEQTYRDCALDK